MRIARGDKNLYESRRSVKKSLLNVGITRNILKGLVGVEGVWASTAQFPFYLFCQLMTFSNFTLQKFRLLV